MKYPPELRQRAVAAYRAAAARADQGGRAGPVGTARAEIFAFVETFYNRRRLRKHINWDYLTPHETRLRYQ
ncbi:hypothetical protein OHB13_10265 [Streptomyces sp. NBC_00440]|uniref:hypothetical protein n=1 Tax=Streptomyces sp. NBC_00440 TaxID=2975741 RepID=UPI002E1AE5BC